MVASEISFPNNLASGKRLAKTSGTLAHSFHRQGEREGVSMTDPAPGAEALKFVMKRAGCKERCTEPRCDCVFVAQDCEAFAVERVSRERAWRPIETARKDSQKILAGFQGQFEWVQFIA